MDPVPDSAAAGTRPDPSRLPPAGGSDCGDQERRRGAAQSLRPDIYIGIAKQLGFAPPDATPESHKAVRKMFKPVMLGIIYGLGPHTLASRIGVSLFEAAEILARLRAQFHVWEDYAQSVGDHAGLELEIGTPLRLVYAVPARDQSAHGAEFPGPIDGQLKSYTSPASSLSAAALRSSRRCTMRLWPRPISTAPKR